MAHIKASKTPRPLSVERSHLKASLSPAGSIVIPYTQEEIERMTWLEYKHNILNKLPAPNTTPTFGGKDHDL